MRHLLASLLSAVALVACGEGDGDTSPPRVDDAPVVVRLDVGGGIAGIERSYVVDTSQPKRLSGEQVDRLVELTSSSAVRGYAGSHVDPADCCDLLEYRLVIEHADGSTTRIVTNDKDDNPAAYDRLLTLVTSGR